MRLTLNIDVVIVRRVHIISCDSRFRESGKTTAYHKGGKILQKSYKSAADNEKSPSTFIWIYYDLSRHSEPKVERENSTEPKTVSKRRIRENQGVDFVLNQ